MAVRANTARDDAKHEDQGSVCDRCWSIPWEDLAIPSESSETTGYDLSLATRQQLRASSCPVCHLFNKVASINSFTSFPVRMTWCDSPYNGPSIGTLSFQDSKPHIIAISMKQDNAQSYLRKVYPRILKVDLASTWIRECASRHGQLCNPLLSAKREHITKFIDCEQRTVVEGSTKCSYVALSYVWGHPSVCPTDGRLKLSCSELDCVLPQTIEDSITLTKALGIKYLWVDRYCIDQSDAKSKHEQIQQMGVIYSSAYLTIIASAGKDPMHGLPGVRGCSRIDPFSVRVRSITLAIHPTRSQINIDIAASRWASRAWTFQECYLSRRRLFFTDSQAQFVCNSCFSLELDRSTQSDLAYLPWEQVATGLDNYTEPHPLGNILPPDVTDPYLRSRIVRDWDGMIQATRYLEVYSNRKLSYDSDALEAIVGTLNTLRDKKRMVRIFHMWGMPVCPMNYKGMPSVWTTSKKDGLFRCDVVAIGLLWYHKAPARRRHDFPSWSSLGWEGSISWQYHEIDAVECGDDPAQEIDIFQRVACLETSYSIFEPRSLRLGYIRLEEANFGGDCPHKALQLRAMTVDVRLATSDVKSDASEPIGSKVAGTIAIPYNTAIEMLVRPYWDTRPTDLGLKQKLKGIIIHPEGLRHVRTGPNAFKPMVQPMMIAKEIRSGTYERVGLCWLPVNSSRHRRLPVQFRNRSRPAKVLPGFLREMSMLVNWSTGSNKTKVSETAILEASRDLELYDWVLRIFRRESFVLE